MKVKSILFFFCVSSFVLLSCTKDEPSINLEGKIIFSKIGLPQYHIKDLKTGQVTSYNGLPYVSPSGGKVVMYDNPDIEVTDFSGKQIMYSYKPNNYSDTDFRWSPDDNKLAVSRSNENNKITIIDLDKKNRSDILMPNNVRKEGFLVWPASDNFIYFMSKNTTNHQSSISRIRADGSGLQHILTLENYQTFDQGFDFHTASDLIVFSLYDSLSRESRICKISTKGDDFKTIYADITHAKYYFYRLKISPDGQNILYEHSYDNDTYAIDINGNNNRVFWSGAGNPHWSSNSQFVLSSHKTGDPNYGGPLGLKIRRFNHSGEATVLIENGLIGFYSWYFD